MGFQIQYSEMMLNSQKNISSNNLRSSFAMLYTHSTSLLQ